jgi:hypothetical protein
MSGREGCAGPTALLGEGSHGSATGLDAPTAVAPEAAAAAATATGNELRALKRDVLLCAIIDEGPGGGDLHTLHIGHVTQSGFHLI